jgi:hypothetical protein
VLKATAKMRLADEYDAAQERGEVAPQGRPEKVSDENLLPTVADIGLTKGQVHEARQIRDAEKADPGIVRRSTPAPSPGNDCSRGDSRAGRRCVPDGFSNC